MTVNRDSSKTISCDDGTSAIVENGSDGSSCTARAIDSGVVVSCGGTIIDTVTDGSDGSSCTARAIDCGVVVSCGGTIIDTITDGSDGAGCTIVDNHEGTLTMICPDGTSASWSKAVCGITVYDPDSSYCNSNALYSRKCGSQIFSPDSQICDYRDSAVYRFVTIGTQKWMAENLNYDTLDASGSWCYGNMKSSCTSYGRLYNWATMMGVVSTYNAAILGDSINHQGICPEGWHVPRASEWNTLVIYAGAATAASVLKATEGWNSSGNGLDEYGFSALPGGYYNGSSFLSDVSAGYWWSATESPTATGISPKMDAHSVYMLNTSKVVTATNLLKTYGQALRCIKD
ncbi:MAG: FISUMP domain-containing protein [Fibrobacteraceae bacterium]